MTGGGPPKAVLYFGKDDKWHHSASPRQPEQNASEGATRIREKRTHHTTFPLLSGSPKLLPDALWNRLSYSRTVKAGHLKRAPTGATWEDFPRALPQRVTKKQLLTTASPPESGYDCSSTPETPGAKPSPRPGRKNRRQPHQLGSQQRGLPGTLPQPQTRDTCSGGSFQPR